jgi:uncharacterized protein
VGSCHPSSVPAEVLGFLTREPVMNNVVLSLVGVGAEPETEGSCWWVHNHSHVTGVAVQTPRTYPLQMTTMDTPSIEALVEAVRVAQPDLGAVTAQPTSAARFAALWGAATAAPAVPNGAQRLHVLELSTPPGSPFEALRPATVSDRPLLLEWSAGLIADTNAYGTDPAGWVDRQLRRGTLWLWDQGGPVSMAALSLPVAGVARISSVYTPPGERRNGYAEACVRALTVKSSELGAGHCVLFTDLDSPGSLGVYCRIGFRDVADSLSFRFA